MCLISDNSVHRMTPNPFDMAELKDFGVNYNRENNHSFNNLRKTPESFLGPNSNLVNLDALVSSQGSDRGKLVLLSLSLFHNNNKIIFLGLQSDIGDFTKHIVISFS